ncbi:TIGR00282 family metallophosphoesterase [Bradyrhizobium sp. Tv2a-2]|uniref:TIGR00282 family metallophosphoesterase n=1 Tax=Bradyrhizobium sp. Tv2a-2 TaxID=113395 RepID=UPI00040C7866|nr:TIGR00282 family metallophosphoesterase [Bradyrhizobium sp. Tv2a-2]
MRILFVGDVVGRAGREAIGTHLPNCISRWKVDLTIVNGENATDAGFGITRPVYDEILAAGADAVTLGNHSWNKKEALQFIDECPRLVRPINYLAGTPGTGAVLIEAKNGQRALVINALGRLFMEPVEDPFGRIAAELDANPLGRAVQATIVDYHCEATGEKHAAGHFCDGRASLVVGTHTHTPSADDRILPRGTAFITDVGMTGDYNSIVGMAKEEPLRRFTTGIPMRRFEPASGEATLCAVLVETDERSGLALSIAPIRIGGCLKPVLPSFPNEKS